MAGRKWTKDDDNFLISNWKYEKKEIILSGLPDRTWSACKRRANQDLRLKRKADLIERRAGAKLECLLEESPEAYYWIGFLIADGSFYNHRIRLTLCDKDKVQVEEFKKFTKNTNPIRSYKAKCNGKEYPAHEIGARNTDIVPKIMEKFGIKQRKTYNPIPIKIIDAMPENLFPSLLIGFIDGDGSICKQSKTNIYIIIKTHSTWLPILQSLSDRISKISIGKRTIAYVNKNGYAVLYLRGDKIIKYLEKYHLKHKLPILERKWDKVKGIV